LLDGIVLFKNKILFNDKINLTPPAGRVYFNLTKYLYQGGGIIMKITTDVNSAGFKPAGNVLPRPSNGAENRSNVLSDAKFSQDVIVKMQRERSIVDALAIAQTSRDLVQKAINISSRLMSLVSEAMLTGRMDTNEVRSQMSGIQGSMGKYGETVSVPIGNSAPPADELQLKIDKSFARLKEKATDMVSGKPVAEKEFKSIASDLKGAASEIDLRIKKYSAEFGRKIENVNFNYQGLNKSTADFVLKNPDKALMSQGNINNEMAGKLTMA
jgi:hypothetical protein